MSGVPGLALDQQTQRAILEKKAAEVFRVQVAMGVLGNEELMKLANHTATSDGSTKAAQLRNRALTILQKYLDQEIG